MYIIYSIATFTFPKNVVSSFIKRALEISERYFELHLDLHFRLSIALRAPITLSIIKPYRNDNYVNYKRGSTVCNEHNREADLLFCQMFSLYYIVRIRDTVFHVSGVRLLYNN